MFGGSLIPGMENDPFFNMHRAHMQRMNQMMQDPFGMQGMHSQMMTSPFLALSDGRGHQRQHERQVPHHQDRGLPGASLDHFSNDPFQSMFRNMNGMMSNMSPMMMNPMAGMHQQMQQPRNSNDSNFYSSSTVMSFSNDGSGQPKVYQATSSTKQADGIQETRKSVRDSHKGIEKMTIGRQIGDKSHVITKERDRRTGDMNENQDLVNLDEDDMSLFEEEWRQKAARGRGPHDRTAHRSVGQHHRPRHHTPAIEHHHRSNPNRPH